MTEQIYINGVLMEQGGDKNISLVFQSPFFTDIDSIVSNRTNSVDFPATATNLRAIDSAHLPGGTSLYAYRRHRVLYYRDGVQIFSGFGTLLSLSPKSIKFSFTWGNVQAFKKLLDLKLRSLQRDGDSVIWNYDRMQSDHAHYDDTMNWGAGNTTIGPGGDLAYVNHPFLKADEVVDRLSQDSGVRIDSSIFSGLVIPLVSKNLDDASRKRNAVVFKTQGTFSDLRIGGLTFHCLNKGTGDDDKKHWKTSGYSHVFNVSNVESVGLHVAASALSFVVTGGYGQMTVLGSENPDMTGAKILYQGGVYSDSTNGQSKHYTNKEISVNINVANIDYIAVSIWDGRGGESFSWSKTPEIFLYDSNDDEVCYGGLFPLYTNLPDWTGSQLLKNLMKIVGVFPVCPDEKTVDFVSIDALYDNRERALDWTERFILDEGRPTEIASKFGSYAQNNICKYADDDTNLATDKAALVVEDETLPTEKDLLTLDFANTEKDSKGALYIRAYEKTVTEDKQIQISFTEVSPRIARIKNAAEGWLEVDSISWEKLLENQYYTYQQVVNHPRIVKAKVLISPLELAELDLTVPVYSYQFGHYYAITKLTTQENNVAQVELLRLNEIRKERPVVPEKVEDLTVIRRNDGSYVTTIPSITPEAATLLKDDSSYKVCIIREGYARRGKNFRYKDITGKTVGSHTDRKNYRAYRKGKRWRIIGEELLIRGRLPQHSQTTRRYAGSTLVCSLGDALILPEMRTSATRFKTRDGHIRNCSQDGLAELSIALYHKGPKVWEMCSNIVKVRGRSADKTELWEFSESNVVRR